MAFTIQDILNDIDSISQKINTNELVTAARTSVKDGIKAFMISPKEKASIIANFEMQFTGNILNKIIDSALQARMSDAQIQSEMATIAIKEKELLIKEGELLLQQAQLDLTGKEILLKTEQLYQMQQELILKQAQNEAQIGLIHEQTNTERQNTAKVTYEVSTLMPAQKLGIDADTAAKTSQKAMIDQQKLTEAQNTAKVTYEVSTLMPAQKDAVVAESTLRTAQKTLTDQQKLTEVQNTTKVGNEATKVTKESELLESNKLLVEAQTRTQEKQRLDVMAGINIKNQQAKATLESARFEEARRHILIDSTLFNNQIQKSKEENALINSLAVDDKFVITDTHLLRAKTALDGITTTKTTYTTGLSGTVPAIEYGT